MAELKDNMFAGNISNGYLKTYAFLNPIIKQSPRRSIIVLIEWYQIYLSPRKGFCCAHRVLHGNDSCSEWVKRLIIVLA